MIEIKELFDVRGYVINGAKIDALFDGHGHINQPVADAVRSHMMAPGCMPAACSDLARLFYAIEAQRKTERKIPAKFFWS